MPGVINLKPGPPLDVVVQMEGLRAEIQQSDETAPSQIRQRARDHRGVLSRLSLVSKQSLRRVLSGRYSR